jgi:uncharacterized lipoprotein YddW (UPF0748 family)
MRFFTQYTLAFLIHFMWQPTLTQAQQPDEQIRDEMRGVWIATVANIDWPSAPGLSSKHQKAEFDSLLNVLKSMNMNAVFVQVRPTGDACYKSSLVPMSSFIVEKQGGPLDDSLYDPLAYMIKATHDRHMEFHAWFNPFRATWNLDTASLDALHPLRSLPEQRKATWFFRYGKRWYFNPASSAVRQYLNNIVKDVLLRYDVDGIHFDDYFYPYKETGIDLEAALHDQEAFNNSGSAFTDIADWRRDNVSKLIETISTTIKKYKPYVKFGISPFGVWRNKEQDPVNGSNTRAGVTCYDDLYADVLLWMKNDWIDYVAPQIYWSVGYLPADFEVLVDWWSTHTFGKQLYIGHAAYKINNAPNDVHWENPSEISKQIGVVRANNNVSGSVFYATKPLLLNTLGVKDSLMTVLYSTPSMMPAMPCLSKVIPSTASICRVMGNARVVQLTWALCELLSGDETPYYYALYRFDGAGIGSYKNPRNLLAITPFYTEKTYFEDDTAVEGEYYTYIITSFNRANVAGNPSDPVFVKKTKNGVRKKRKYWGYLF